MTNGQSVSVNLKENFTTVAFAAAAADKSEPIGAGETVAATMAAESAEANRRKNSHPNFARLKKAMRKRSASIF